MKKKRTALIIFIALLFSVAYKFDGIDNTAKILLWNNVLIRSASTSGIITFYAVNNPSSPAKISEIEVKGNSDVAVKYRYLYADSYRDLIIYDLSDLASPKALDTLKNIFQTYYDSWQMNDFVGTTTGCFGCGKNVVADAAPGATAGSLSRFAVVDDYLYCIDGNSLHILDISDPAKPVKIKDLFLNWDIETLYPDGDYLFVGSRSGMYIFNIENRAEPEETAKFLHVNSCDPVFVEDSVAYVTLREGTLCEGFLNELEIIDISDVAEPTMINAVKMTYPFGLSVKNKIAYICEGFNGLTILDANNPENPDTLARYGGDTFNDAILSDTLLYLTGDNGITILSVADPERPKFLSGI